MSYSTTKIPMKAIRSGLKIENMSTNATKTKILIVDNDEHSLQKAAENVETDMGNVTIYTATHGSEGLAKITNDRVNILITSMELPKMSGADMIRSALREPNMKQAAIIAIANDDNENDFNNEIVMGRMQILQRPVSTDRFLQALARARGYIATSSNSSEFRILVLAPGEHLCREGDSASHAYYVRRGILHASRTEDEKTILLGEIKHDEFVGEMAHLVSGKRSADVVAVSSSELIEIPIAALDAILYSKPGWARAMMKTLSRRVINQNRKIKT